MTPKQLLNKANKSKSAIKFFQEQRQYLLGGEMSAILSPIVRRVDAGDVMPTPALQEVAQHIAEYLLYTNLADAETKRQHSEDRATPKNWTVKILDAEGNLGFREIPKGDIEFLTASFETAQEADTWANNKLSSLGSIGWSANISHLHSKAQTSIQRDEALSAVNKRKVGAATKKTKKTTTNRLGFGPGPHSTSRASFSRG
jgi:hypothetical protein